MVPLTMPSTRLTLSPARLLAQRAEQRDRAGDGGLEVEVDARLRRRRRRGSAPSSASSALLAVTTDAPCSIAASSSGAGRLDAAHDLDDDVHVGACHQRGGVGGQRARGRRRAARCRGAGTRDTDELDGAPTRAARSSAWARQLRATSLPTTPQPSSATLSGCAPIDSSAASCRGGLASYVARGRTHPSTPATPVPGLSRGRARSRSSSVSRRSERPAAPVRTTADHRRARHVVVVSRPSTGSRRRSPATASRSPGARSAGQPGVLDHDVAALAVLADDARQHRLGASRARETSAHGVLGVVERGADVVAHPAVDGDVGPRRRRRRARRLDGADLVERQRAAARRWRGPARPTARGTASRRRALAVDDRRAAARRSRRRGAGRRRWCTRCRGRRRGRARRSSTPCSSRIAASSPTTRWAATSKPDVSKICEPMCECRPTSSSDGELEDPAHRLGRVRRRRARSRTSGPRGRSR